LLRVPEPASVLLIAGALAAMLFALRRRPLAHPSA
jgi:hypothetical protein